jgi:hypothetical protein
MSQNNLAIVLHSAGYSIEVMEVGIAHHYGAGRRVPGSLDFEGTGDVTDEDAAIAEEDSDHVEAVGLTGAAVAVDPGLRGVRELALFAAVHGFDGIDELVAGAGLHFDERDEVVVLCDEIDVALA